MSAWSDWVLGLSGLVGYWRLGETSGTTADNAEGTSAKDGTYTGGYTLNQGSLVSLVDADPATSFNGSTGYVTVPDHSDFSLGTTGALTVAIWHSPTSGSDTVLIGKGTSSNYEWAIYRSASSYYALVWTSAGAGRATVNNAPASVAPNGGRNWVVLTLDDSGGDSGILYVNGYTGGAAVTGWSGTSTNGTSPLDIGRRPDNTAYNAGVADEVFVVNRVLSASEVIAGMRKAQAVYLPRGTGARNTGSENTYAITPASNFTGTAGAMAVLVVAYDNSGTNGADPYSGCTDTNSNTWTSRQNALNDPGAASAGIALRILTTPMDGGALDTGDTITVAFGGKTTVARAYALWEVLPQDGYSIAYGTGATETATTASPTITTSSIAAGDVVIGAIGREGNDAATADTDSSNGTWGAQQASGVGTTTSGAQVASQAKVVLATGTQTYNPTFGASRDGAEAWVSIVQSVASVTATPGTASLALTAYAPAVGQGVVPATASLALTSYAPSAVVGVRAVPATAALALATFAPTVTATAHQTVTPGAASLATTAYAPTVTASDHKVVMPATAALSLTAHAPTVTATANVAVVPDTASLALSAHAPTVTAGDAQSVVPGTASLSLSAFAPAVTATAHVVATPGAASLSMTAFAPGVAISDHKVVTPATAALSLTAFAPSTVLSDHKVATPGTASLSLGAFAPDVSTSLPIVVEPLPASLELSALPASVYAGPPFDWDRAVGVVGAPGVAGTVTVSVPAAAIVTVDATLSGAVTVDATAASVTTSPDPPGVAS